MAEMIRVATIIKRLHIAGDQIRVLTMARELDRSRFQHVVIVVESSDAERDGRMGPMLERYREHDVEVVVLGTELHTWSNAAPDRPRSRGSSIRDLLTGIRLLRAVTVLLKKRGIHVVDARLELGTVLGVLAARLARVPVVVSTGYSPTFWRPPVLWAFGQAALALVDAFVSDAKVTVDAYDRWRLSRRARMVVIPNGVYPVVSTRSRADVRTALRLPSDAVVVGQIGRLLPHKGHDVFIRAAKVVLEREPRSAFLLCGYAEDPAYGESLARLVAQLGLSERFVLLGHSGPMSDIFGALDVLAHLSAFDSSPLVVHEAMSAAIPSVVTPVGGLPELVTDGETGYFVPQGDVQAAADAILRLVRDEELRNRLGAAALKQYRERHLPETLARSHEQLFVDLLREKGRAPGDPPARESGARRPDEVHHSQMKRLRIAMIGQRGLPATHGGVERHVEELGAELAALGHEVTVYCRKGYAEPALPDYRGMRLRHLPSVGTKHLEALVHSLACTVDAMRSAPDVIHYHAIGPAVWAAVPRFLGHRAAVTVTVHGMDQDRAKWGSSARKALALAAWLSGRVPDATMAPSRTLAEHYRRSGARLSAYVPHGARRRQFRTPDEIVTRFGIVPGSYFLFVGRLVPEKRPDLLLRAFSRLPGERQLVVVGGSSYTDDYVEDLQRIAAADPRVVMTGYAYGSLLEELFSNAAALVSPSQLEGVPLTVLEAATYGLPLVASDIPGHLEVLGTDDGPGHRLFPEGDEDALVGALTRAVLDPDEERTGAAALQARVLAEHDWGTAARLTEEVYRAVGRPAARRRLRPRSLRPRPAQRFATSPQSPPASRD